MAGTTELDDGHLPDVVFRDPSSPARYRCDSPPLCHKDAVVDGGGCCVEDRRNLERADHDSTTVAAAIVVVKEIEKNATRARRKSGRSRTTRGPP